MGMEHLHAGLKSSHAQRSGISFFRGRIMLTSLVEGDREAEWQKQKGRKWKRGGNGKERKKGRRKGEKK